MLRAKIVLAAWRRKANAKIARDLGIGEDTVRTWRGRFGREGMPRRLLSAAGRVFRHVRQTECVRRGCDRWWHRGTAASRVSVDRYVAGDTA
ncbi:MAG: helix-turn-helix domain-containing protein [Pseudonocardiaceae bacterium]